MPKNQKSKPRLSRSVTRSGKCFSDLAMGPKKATADSINPVQIQNLSDELAMKTQAEPVSGIRNATALQSSPVSPLLAGQNDEERWKDDNSEYNLDTVSIQKQSGNTQILFGTDEVNVAEKDEIGNNDVMSSVEISNERTLEKLATLNCAVVPPKVAAKPKCSPVTNCTQAARQNATKNTQVPPPVTDGAVNHDNPSSVLPHSILTASDINMHNKQSYASLFSSLPRCAGAYIPRDFTSSADDPIPPTEIVQEGVAYWKDHLIGFFLDSEIPCLDIRAHCYKAWNLRGGLRFNVVNGIFYFKFSIMEERRKVLESDPAIIGGKPFIITSWSTTVESARERVLSIPVWTIFTRIPSFLQTLPGLNWLASRIGTFKCFDANTEARKNLVFAKSLIEITPSKQLPDKLMVSIDGYDFFVHVQYSWKPEICTNCQSFGHLLDTCKHVGPSKDRSPLKKPPPSIWVQKTKVDDKLDEEVQPDSQSNEATCVDKPQENDAIDLDGESVDVGIRWMSDDRSWLHEVSGMRYDPVDNEYYKYVTDIEEDNRRLEYQVMGDSFELISVGELGEKNKSLFYDSTWDWECEFRSPNPCFVPNLAVLFSEYVNVIGSDTNSYVSLNGD